MISKIGKETGQDLSPVSKLIRIDSSVVDGEVVPNAISFRKLSYFLVQNGKRIAEVNDSPDGWHTEQFSIKYEDVPQELRDQLMAAIVAIFENNIEVPEGYIF